MNKPERKALQFRYTDKPNKFCGICGQKIQRIEFLDTLNDEWIITFDDYYTCSYTCRALRNKKIRKEVGVGDFNLSCMYG